MINNRNALGKVSIKILIFLFGNWKGGKKVNFLFVILLDEFFHYSLIGCFQFRNFRQFITVQWANWREIKLWAKTWMMGVVRRYWKPHKQKPKHIWLSLNNQRNNQEAPSTKNHSFFIFITSTIIFIFKQFSHLPLDIFRHSILKE